MEDLNAKINEKLDDHCHREKVPADGLTLDDEDLNDEPESEPKIEQDDYTDKAYDAYLGAELLVPSGDNFIIGQVTKQVWDMDGNPIRIRNNNPLLDSHQYEVQF